MSHGRSHFRLVLACLVGFAGGAAGLPAALSWANGATAPAGFHTAVDAAVRIPARAQTHKSALLPVQSHHSADNTGGMGPASLYGTTPAMIVSIYDVPCYSYVTTSATEAQRVAAVDPRKDIRFKRCGATVNDFKIQWTSTPTAAQTKALMQAMGSLALNHPTISLQDVTPIIRAAVLAAS